MSYHRHPSPSYVVIRKQGISPVRIVRHSLTKKKAQSEADFLNSQFKERKDARAKKSTRQRKKNKDTVAFRNTDSKSSRI